jgi:ABC-type multidrug transport system permease subunit
MKKTMGHDIHTLEEARALALRTWRNAAPFFLSIELALMVLAAMATVAGVWLAVLLDARSLLAFGFAIAYMATRTVLHLKRKLSWPFI